MQIPARQLIHKGRNSLLGLILACSLSLGPVVGLAGSRASALSCDTSNIVYCGLDQRNTQTSIDSLQMIYHDNTDSSHHDIRPIFRWAGATNASVAGMNTSNTKLGTLYRNGDVKVGGRVVAHDSWVAARFTKGQGFVKVSNGVWARKTTTSFSQASSRVLVHYNQSGTADWAVMTNCGNPIKFTPVMPARPQPKPQPSPQPRPHPQPQPQPAANVSCVSLTATPSADNSRNYTFQAEAALSDGATIGRYVFDFGDQQSSISTSGDQTAIATHMYDKDAGTVTARVTIFALGSDAGITSNNCAVTIPLPAAPAQPAECKPGIPVGSDECNETPTVLGATTTTPAQPATPAEETTELPHTGSDNAAIGVGVFGASAIAGTLGFRFWMRRKLQY